MVSNVERLSSHVHDFFADYEMALVLSSTTQICKICPSLFLKFDVIYKQENFKLIIIE